MLTEDYLIRMINLAISALLRIVGLKKAGDFQEARLLIDITFEQMLGLRASVAKNLDDGRLYYLLTRNNRLDTRRLALIAELFWHEGEIAAAQNREQESREAYTRALRYNLEVLFSATDDTNLQDEVRPKIELLTQSVDVASLGAETLWPLAGYYEDSGAYALAENILLLLAGRPELQNEIRPELVAFYGRLLEKPEQALESGGVNHAQVRERLKRLQSNG